MSTSNLSSIAAAPPKRSVKFSDIEIREYETALGDNPSVRAGPPIGLGWEYAPAGILKVEDYEQQRGPRRSRQEILIPRFVREEKLRDFGVSREEISLCVQSVEKAKRNRSATMRSTDSMEKVTEGAQSARRKLKRCFGLWKEVELMPSYITVSSGSLKKGFSMNDMDKVVLVSPVYKSANQAKSCCNLSGLTAVSDEIMLLADEKNDASRVVSVEKIRIPPKTLKISSSFGSGDVGASTEELKSSSSFGPSDVDTSTEEDEDPLSF